MDSYLHDLEKLIASINRDQKEYLIDNVKDEMLQRVVDSGNFNNAYMDATRKIKSILIQASKEIKVTIDDFNKDS